MGRLLQRGLQRARGRHGDVGLAHVLALALTQPDRAAVAGAPGKDAPVAPVPPV